MAAVVLVAGLSACGGTDPHAAARAQVTSCLRGVGALHPDSVLSAPTYLVAERIAEEREAAARCNPRTFDALARKYPSDTKLVLAGRALHSLDAGVRDYGGYLDERQSALLTVLRTDLDAARDEISRGEVELRESLDQLSH